MHARFVAIWIGLLAALLFGLGSVTAGQVPSVTAIIVEPTYDPCAEPPVSDAGEEVDPCATETPFATIDPCNPGETQVSAEENPCASPTATPTFDPCIEGTGEEVDPCQTPSPSPTESEPAPEPTATMTPTLEYEIDVPISFFPTETVEGEPEETLAAATETDATKVAGVTDLPNAGGVGPSQGNAGLLGLIAGMLLVATLALMVRARASSES